MTLLRLGGGERLERQRDGAETARAGGSVAVIVIAVAVAAVAVAVGWRVRSRGGAGGVWGTECGWIGEVKRGIVDVGEA